MAGLNTVSKFREQSRQIQKNNGFKGIPPQPLPKTTKLQYVNNNSIFTSEHADSLINDENQKVKLLYHLQTYSLIF